MNGAMFQVESKAVSGGGHVYSVTGKVEVLFSLSQDGKLLSVYRQHPGLTKRMPMGRHFHGADCFEQARKAYKSGEMQAMLAIVESESAVVG